MGNKAVTLLLVAPFNRPELNPSTEITLVEPGSDSEFTDRDTQVDTLTKPVSRDLPTPDSYQDPETGLTTRFKDLSSHSHFGAEFLTATVTVTSASADPLGSRDDVVCLEGATSRAMAQVAAQQPGGEVGIRWVARTLLCGSETDPGLAHWFQQRGDQEFVTLGDGVVKGLASWGNSAVCLPVDTPLPTDAVNAAVMAQFIWCYANDIEALSLDILQRVQGELKRDELLKTVIDLHYELAVQSVFYERLNIESSPLARSIVLELLGAWSYERVIDSIDSRLSRLEHILSARSEMLRRRASTIINLILFVVTLTTIISLVLGFVQTSFSGPVPSHPDGFIMDYLRNSNLDLWLTLPAVACLLLILVLVWRLAPRRENHWLRSSPLHRRGGEGRRGQ